MNGWNVISEIEFLTLQTGFEGKPDITIEFGNVPEELDGAVAKGVGFQIKPNHYILNIDGTGRFMAINGNQIFIDAVNGANEEDIVVYVLGSAFGAIAHQRGLLPMHASSVNYKGKAILFSGASGTGKSTLAKAFEMKGYPVICDDMSAIYFDNQVGMVHPGDPRLKLWGDVLTEIKTEDKDRRRVRDGLEKFFLNHLHQIVPEPVRPTNVFILHKSNEVEITIDEIRGKEKFHALRTNVYRARLVNGLGVSKASFNQIEKLNKQVKVYRVYRPTTTSKVLALANEIQKILDN